MSELVEFLRARLEEDEAAALLAAGPIGDHWSYRSGCIFDANEYDSLRLEMGDRQCGDHIARHDPARVLAEVAAKRRIVEWHAEPHYCTDQGNLESWYTPEHPCPTLRAMTLPHANHQDYRQEWAP